MVVVVSHVSGRRRTWCINRVDRETWTGEVVLQALAEREGPASDVVLQCQGRVVYPSTLLDGKSVVVATLRLPGGKGGFGSMLRAIGAQIEKTTNREACRDLSGRRLRDINEEKRLKDFIAKKADKEREMKEKKLQMIRMLQESPRHTFEDKAYFEQRELREKNLFDSLDKAFASKDDGSSSSTSSTVKEAPVTKHKKGMFLDDLDNSSGEEENDEAEARPQETIDNSSTSDSTDNSSSGSTTQQEGDKTTTCQSTDTLVKKESGSSGMKRKSNENPMARLKKGRFMDDLDESSSEDEENNEDTEAKLSKSSDSSSNGTNNSNSNNSSERSKQDDDKVTSKSKEHED